MAGGPVEWSKRLKIFTDYHHGDLYYSLSLLFEKRLGFELYRPIGWEWFNQGFWKIAEPYGNAVDTIGQYLDINKDGYHPYRNLNGEHYVQDEIYHVYNPGHNFYHRAITLEKFKNMNFDVIMSTYEGHEDPFLRLKSLYQPNAVMLAQMGNVGQKSRLPNVIHSVPYLPLPGQRAVYYHQEIDFNLYKYTPPNKGTKNIYSFVNLYPYPEIYALYKGLLSEIQMKYYGAGCPDGALSGCETVAKKMQEANIGWHLKPQDGFGHTALGWFASGRPVITTMKDVVRFGGEATSLFEPGVTCLDIEARTVHENCRVIRRMLDPGENNLWCENAYKRFREVVNYDLKALEIKKLLEGVLP